MRIMTALKFAYPVKTHSSERCNVPLEGSPNEVHQSTEPEALGLSAPSQPSLPTLLAWPFHLFWRYLRMLTTVQRLVGGQQTLSLAGR